MKRLLLLSGTFFFWALSTAAQASFISGSTGTLGAFNPTTNTVVTLPPDGVLNYTTINIPAGVTVTFTNNAANTPVYMLATGDVTINGTINVNGINGGTGGPGQGGPGGFNGGYAGTTTDPGGRGLGPGGGNAGTFNAGCDWNYNDGGGGSFGTSGRTQCAAAGSTYGNARLLPLIGGSGGGGAGGPGNPLASGGGGGGAVLIASSVNIILNGAITANGGGVGGNNNSGCGSGGGIRLIANSISGTGSLSAVGGTGGNNNYGGAGRIRIESYTNTSSIAANPAASLSSPGNVFVAASPTLTITSIANTAVPANPTGSYSQPDIPLPSTTTNPVLVNISATNIPDGSTVTVWVIPQYGSATSVNSILSSSTATANVILSTTYSNVITAQATFTVVGMYYNGEEIDKVRVATKLGGGSETTYITKAGKEIKGELVAALMK